MIEKTVVKSLGWELILSAMREKSVPDF